MAREPPDLADAAIVAALRAHFGLEIETLRFLPIGNDPGSWAYRVQAAGEPPGFLKVRAGTGAMPGAAVPGYLHRLGVPNLPVPRATLGGAPYLVVDRFTLALWPMLEAGAGAEVGLSAAQWRQLGATLRRVHGVPPTPELTGMVGRETFRPAGRDRIPDLRTRLSEAAADPLAAELARFWLGREEVIAALLERADRLGRELARDARPRVLCHADLHTWNVLVDADQRLWIVDWDDATLAPRERDLMFVIGGIGRDLVRPEDTDRFFQGYGQATVDPRLLAYYRAAWAVQDLAAYGQGVLMAPWLGPESRRAELDGLMSLFEPGNIVEIAMTLAAPPPAAPPPRA